MAQTDSVIIALDVSKDRLDCLDADTGEVFQVKNSVSGRASLAARYYGRAIQCVLEASGGYERPAIHDLCRAGLSVRLVDPRKVRFFARASGRWVKNDRLDAEMIAAYAMLADRARLLLSIPGVGPVLCTALLAFLPELGQLTRHQVAALAGVAPMDHDSGRR